MEKKQRLARTKLNKDFAEWYMAASAEAGQLVDMQTATRLLGTTAAAIRDRRDRGTIRHYIYKPTPESKPTNTYFSLEDILVIGFTTEAKRAGMEMTPEDLHKLFANLRQRAVYSLAEIPKSEKTKEQ
jgi:hypothetical protein